MLSHRVKPALLASAFAFLVVVFFVANNGNMTVEVQDLDSGELDPVLPVSQATVAMPAATTSVSFQPGDLTSYDCGNLAEAAEYPNVIDVVNTKLGKMFRTLQPNFTCQVAFRQIISGEDALWMRGTLGSSPDIFVLEVIRVPEVDDRISSFGPDSVGNRYFTVNPVGPHSSVIDNNISVAAKPEHQKLQQETTSPQPKFYLKFVDRIFGNTSDPAIPSALLADIHQEAKSLGWSFRLSSRSAFTTLQQMHHRLGHEFLTPEQKALVPKAPEPTSQQLAAVASQASFDWRSNYANCVGVAIQDQGNCGCCWAFASSKMFSLRMCRNSSQSVNIAMAEQDYLSCYKKTKQFTTDPIDYYGTPQQSNGCNGGSAVMAFLSQIHDGGYSIRACNPYVAKGYQSHPCGSRSCPNGVSSPTMYTALGVYQVSASVNAIKVDLTTNGPVYAGFDVYSDFDNYNGGVYSPTKAALSAGIVGGHAVVIMGWGTSSGTSYWLVANSWGSDWGENGFFRIKMGTCNFEQDIYGVTVKVPNFRCPASCQNGGALQSDCTCLCSGNWQGNLCNTCSISSCSNGGTLNSKSCNCTCASGYFGPSCSNYVIGYWSQGANASGIAFFTLRWKFFSYDDGTSYISRYVSFPSSPSYAVDSPYKIPTVTGSGTVAVALGSYIVGYPKYKYYYGVSVSLGVNEFGASRGYTDVDIPVFTYNTQKKCLGGGNLPPADATTSKVVRC